MQVPRPPHVRAAVQLLQGCRLQARWAAGRKPGQALLSAGAPVASVHVTLLVDLPPAEMYSSDVSCALLYQPLSEIYSKPCRGAWLCMKVQCANALRGPHTHAGIDLCRIPACLICVLVCLASLEFRAPPQDLSQGPQAPAAQTCSLHEMGLHGRCRGSACNVALHASACAGPEPFPALQMAVRDAVPPPHCALHLP